MAKKKNTLPTLSGGSKPTTARQGSASISTAPSAASPARKPAHDQVAKRAYEIWIAKGRPVGRDLENWQQAERELGGRI